MTLNSASAERVFSLPKAMFGDARATSLSDLVEGSLMLKFNKAKRKAEKEARGRRLLAPTIVMPILSCSHTLFTPRCPRSLLRVSAA